MSDPLSYITIRTDVLNQALGRAALRHGVTKEAILSESRRRKHVLARQEAIHELRETRRPNGDRAYSLEEIGRRMNRHHATILHALKAHKAREGLG